MIHAPGFAGMPSRGQVRSAVGERVLQRVLGQREVSADVADERGEDAPGLLAEGALDRARAHIPGISITGRTSMAPWRAAGIRAACAVAVSRSGQSSR